MSYSSQLEDGYIIVKDNDDGLSVTNQAEKVVQDVCERYGKDKRIFYRDTDGYWDELVHQDGYFRRFQVHQARFWRDIVHGLR